MSERKQIIPQYGPFAGMRVIDSGSLIAMPYAATLLADFGAEVIHIERPGVGDTLRVLAPFAKEDGTTGGIQQIVVATIDGKTLLPNVWYGANLERRTVN